MIWLAYYLNLELHQVPGGPVVEAPVPQDHKLLSGRPHLEDHLAHLGRHEQYVFEGGH